MNRQNQRPGAGFWLGSELHSATKAAEQRQPYTTTTRRACTTSGQKQRQARGLTEGRRAGSARVPARDMAQAQCGGARVSIELRQLVHVLVRRKTR